MSTRFSGENEDFSAYIRDLTQDEIDTFWQQGWVYAPNFIDAELVEQVRQHYKAWTGIKWDEWPADPEEQRKFTELLNSLQTTGIFFNIRLDDAWMNNFITQKKLGKASADLLKVPSVKLLSDTLHVKQPASSGHSAALRWHQDFPSMPLDRAEALQTWIALAPITPDMGPMSHMNGSHREMPNGIHQLAGETAEEAYPELWDKYEVSEPRQYAAGDVLFHHCLTYHSSAANQTDRIRWAMSSLRFSSRTLYTGQSLSHTNGLGMEPLKRFDHPNFPTVYP